MPSLSMKPSNSRLIPKSLIKYIRKLIFRLHISCDNGSFDDLVAHEVTVCFHVFCSLMKDWILTDVYRSLIIKVEKNRFLEYNTKRLEQFS